MRARLERTLDGARGVGTTCDSMPPAETARPSGTGNKSPVVRPAWQRRACACHAWTAAERVKSEPTEKTLAPSQGSTDPAKLGPGRRMAETRKRGDLPAVVKQAMHGGYPSGRASPRTPPLEKADNPDFDPELGITPASPAPETRDCARVVHMRARWLMYVCVPPHGEGDRQHVVQPAVVRALRRPG